MNRLIVSCCLALCYLPTITKAEDAETIPPNHSAVRIVFALPKDEFPAEVKSLPMFQVSGTILPSELINPISITIDEDFVGHALLSMGGSVEPRFILPAGEHKFTFTREGHKSVSKKLKVLGTGSKQILVIKITLEDKAKDSEEKKEEPARKD